MEQGTKYGNEGLYISHYEFMTKKLYQSKK